MRNNSTESGGEDMVYGYAWKFVPRVGTLAAKEHRRWPAL